MLKGPVHSMVKGPVHTVTEGKGPVHTVIEGLYIQWLKDCT